MFQFTTQTIYNQIDNKNLVAAPSGKTPQLRIGNTRFNKADIIDIQIKSSSAEQLASVTFDMADIINATAKVNARIVLYINLSMNSQDAFYANDLVYKGKPLYIEFSAGAGETPDKVAKRVVNIANKYQLFTAQEKILNVTSTTDSTSGSETGTVTFTGVNGYQIISKAVLQKYNEEAKTVNCCENQGDFEDVVIGVPVIYTISNGTVYTKDANDKQYKLVEGTEVELADNEVAILPGLEAFGDYNWIMHNLRLPTLANTHHFAPTKEEMPSVGQTYTQFCVSIMTTRDRVAGEVIGQRAYSVTNHILYVAGNANTSGSSAYKVKQAFTTLLGADAATKIKTDADTALANPFNTQKTLVS